MKYLDKASFSGRANTPEFERNYDKIDWSDRVDKDKKPPMPQNCKHGHRSCEQCQWIGGYPIEFRLKRGV